MYVHILLNSKHAKIACRLFYVSVDLLGVSGYYDCGKIIIDTHSASKS